METFEMNPDKRSDATSLAVTLHGAGPEPVLVLHDWNGDHHNYDPVLPYLDGKAFTYAFVDLRGYGGSRHLGGDYTLPEIAADCLGVADRLGLPRFHLIGHSMAGMATQRLAAAVPARIKSVVAVCPLSAAGSPAPAEAVAFFETTGADDDAFCRLIRFVSGDLGETWVRAKLRQSRAAVTPAARAGYLRMFTQTRFVDEVQGLDTAFLVLVGDHDPGLDEAAMRQTFLDWHPRAELVAIPNCGHYPMQECPPFFATLVERFLRRHAD